MTYLKQKNLGFLLSVILFSNILYAGKWEDFKDWASEHKKQLGAAAVAIGAAVTTGVLLANKSKTNPTKNNEIVNRINLDPNGYLLGTGIRSLQSAVTIRKGTLTKMLPDCGPVITASCQFRGSAEQDGPLTTIYETATFDSASNTYKVTIKTNEKLLQTYRVTPYKSILNGIAVKPVPAEERDTIYCSMPFFPADYNNIFLYFPDIKNNEFTASFIYENGTKQIFTVLQNDDNTQTIISSTVVTPDGKSTTADETI